MQYFGRIFVLYCIFWHKHLKWKRSAEKGGAYEKGIAFSDLPSVFSSCHHSNAFEFLGVCLSFFLDPSADRPTAVHPVFSAHPLVQRDPSFVWKVLGRRDSPCFPCFGSSVLNEWIQRSPSPLAPSSVETDGSIFSGVRRTVLPDQIKESAIKATKRKPQGLPLRFAKEKGECLKSVVPA